MNIDVFKIIGVAFITAITSILLKSAKPETSFVITVAGIVVILLMLTSTLKDTIFVFNSIFGAVGVNNGLMKLILKIVGVGYITEFAAGILNDFGSSSIANKVVFAGKIAIVILSIPVLESLLTLVKGFLELV